MKRCFFILCLISFIYGITIRFFLLITLAQTELTSGVATTASLIRYSPCYSIYANANDPVNIELQVLLADTSDVYVLGTLILNDN